MRIYHNVSAEDDVNWRLLREMFADIRHVDLCNASMVAKNRELGATMFAMTWRFLPLLDNLVDRFLSRDCDSPILQREIDAVQQWYDVN